MSVKRYTGESHAYTEKPDHSCWRHFKPGPASRVSSKKRQNVCRQFELKLLTDQRESKNRQLKEMAREEVRKPPRMNRGQQEVYTSESRLFALLFFSVPFASVLAFAPTGQSAADRQGTSMRLRIYLSGA